jgi:hypothetical protein
MCGRVFMLTETTQSEKGGSVLQSVVCPLSVELKWLILSRYDKGILTERPEFNTLQDQVQFVTTSRQI